MQDTDSANADRIAQMRGSHAKKLEFARLVRSAGLPLTINAPIHRHNIGSVPRFIELAIELGAQRLEIAHVQYYGWALENRAALMPTRAQALESARIVAAARSRLRGIITIDFVVPDYYAAYPKPCMGGWGRGSICVTPSGKALPCHAAQSIPHLRFDNVRDRSLSEIWHGSEAFRAFRGTRWMGEPCRTCERRTQDWGGCRCQAFAFTGAATEADPACVKSSAHASFAAMAERQAQASAPRLQFRNAREAHRRALR
jgi:pyrroloquinoline quinone biosynthesis protein E